MLCTMLINTNTRDSLVSVLYLKFFIQNQLQGLLCYRNPTDVTGYYIFNSNNYITFSIALTGCCPHQTTDAVNMIKANTGRATFVWLPKLQRGKKGKK